MTLYEHIAEQLVADGHYELSDKLLALTKPLTGVEVAKLFKLDEKDPLFLVFLSTANLIDAYRMIGVEQ